MEPSVLKVATFCEGRVNVGIVEVLTFFQNSMKTPPLSNVPHLLEAPMELGLVKLILLPQYFEGSK